MPPRVSSRDAVTSGPPPCVVDWRDLHSISRRCFEGLGLAREDSTAVADVLVDANLSGTPSHGFQRVPAYMRRVHAGLAGGTEAFTIAHEQGGLCRIDAGHALGPAAAVRALHHGIALARTFGVSTVAVGASTHFGRAGYYARKAAEAQMLALVMTNSVKRIAPHGASSSFLGTNPLAIGVPLAERDPFVLDMATSVEAGGKIIRAREAGRQLPPGIALDAGGRPTTDPGRALQGSLLPIAGAKGSGLALAVSLLAVLLGGADCDDVMASLHNDLDRPQNVGHVFILIDFSTVTPVGGVRRVDAMVERLLALTPADGHSRVRYPGQDNRAVARRNRAQGIQLEAVELTSAAETCRECGLADLANELLAMRCAGRPQLDRRIQEPAPCAEAG